jgi:hypothetical protein
MAYIMEESDTKDVLELLHKSTRPTAEIHAEILRKNVSRIQVSVLGCVSGHIYEPVPYESNSAMSYGSTLFSLVLVRALRLHEHLVLIGLLESSVI